MVAKTLTLLLCLRLEPLEYVVLLGMTAGPQATLASLARNEQIVFAGWITSLAIKIMLPTGTINMSINNTAPSVANKGW